MLLLMFFVARVIKAVERWDERRIRAGKPPVGRLPGSPPLRTGVRS